MPKRKRPKRVHKPPPQVDGNVIITHLEGDTYQVAIPHDGFQTPLALIHMKEGETPIRIEDMREKEPA